MAVKKLLAVVALCALTLCFAGLMAPPAFAQDSDAARGLDKDIAQRRGVSGSLAPIKKDGKSKGATPVQMAIGLGSIVVMVVVVKWL